MSAPARRWEDVYATQTARITELERENVALRKENVKLRQVLEGQSDEIRTPHIANDAAFAAIDAARKGDQP